MKAKEESMKPIPDGRGNGYWRSNVATIRRISSGSIKTFDPQEMGRRNETDDMVDPVALGDGTPVFQGMKHKLGLKLTGTRTLKSGVVLLSYQPMKEQSI